MSALRNGFVVLFGLLFCVGRAGAGPAAECGPSRAQLLARVRLERRLGCALRVRWDPRTGQPARVRFDPPLRLPGAPPRACARRALGLVAPLAPGLDLGALVPAAVTGLGAWRRVRFRQVHLGFPVREGGLSVLLSRRGGVVRLHALGGRFGLDLPAALPATTARRGVRAGRTWVRLDDGWTLARRRIVWREGLPHEELLGANGEVLQSQCLALPGRVSGTVARVDGSRARAPLSDLYVRVDRFLRGASQQVTDFEGVFPGRRGRLLAGLSGPYVLVDPTSASAYPTRAQGEIVLDFSPHEPAGREVNVFFHLNALREFWIGEHPGLRQVLRDYRLHAAVVADPEARLDGNARAFPYVPGSDTGQGRLGRGFDAGLRFGSRAAELPAVVAHEHGHTVLYALGFVPLRAPRGSSGPLGVHEGLADYLASCYARTSRVMEGFAPSRQRDIAEDRIYPQDLSGEAHLDGWILASALWDAEALAGPTERTALRRAVVDSVPGYDGATTLVEAAQGILEAASTEGAREALRRAFAEHGLLPSDEPLPPHLEVLDGGLDGTSGLSVEAGTSRRVEVLARGRHERSAVRLLAQGLPPWAVPEGEDAEEPTSLGSEDRAAFVFRPPPGAEGLYRVTFVAQDEHSGRDAARTITVEVLPAGETVLRRWNTSLRGPFRVALGEARTFPLGDLFDELARGGDSSRYAYELVGTLIPFVDLAGGSVVVAPSRAEHAGAYAVQVLARPLASPYDPTRVLLTTLKLVVGEDRLSLLLRVYRSEGGFQSPYHLLPGERLAVYEGETVDLEPWLEEVLQEAPQSPEAGKDEAKEVPRTARRHLRLEGAPDWVRSVSTEVRGQERTRVRLQPPLGYRGDPDLEFRVVVEEEGTGVVVRRPVRIVVVRPRLSPPALRPVPAVSPSDAEGAAGRLGRVFGAAGERQ